MIIMNSWKNVTAACATMLLVSSAVWMGQGWLEQQSAESSALRVSLPAKAFAPVLPLASQMQPVSFAPASRNAKGQKTKSADKSPQAITAAHLESARELAGLSGQRKSVNAAYRRQLMAASQAAVNLPENQQDEALRAMIGIWRAADGRKAGSWANVPFKMSAFKDKLAIKAIIERAALADWQSGNKAAALRKYQSLSRDLRGQVHKADIDLRILDLQRMEYHASKNFKAYEATLASLSRAYVDPGILGASQETRVQSTAQEISRRYENLVSFEMQRVATKNAAKPERSRAIALANRFLPVLTDNKRIEDMRGRIAGLYALNDQHKQAVAIYKELAESGAAEGKRRYLALAIASQSVLARWPLEAPWSQQLQSVAASERVELQALYRTFGSMDGKQINWSVLAHTGLIDVSMGQPEQAFSAWREALKTNTQSPHAGFAAGYMLVAYERAKAWGDLESVARLSLKAQMSPSFRGKAISPSASLGLALLEGGKEFLANNDFKTAVSKLKEFVAQYQAHKRHDEGMLALAHAYRGNGEHKASIETLLAFVERHPTSKYLRDALLSGGDWSAPLTYEENAMSFYASFLAKFPGDAETPRVRETVIGLYLGRSLYAEALMQIRNKAGDKRTSVEEKTDALVQVMELEERYGSVERAGQAADRIIAGGGAVTPEAQAVAYSVKARHAMQRGDMVALQQIESRLASLAGSDAQLESLGEVRFYLAEARGSGLVKKYFNLALKDPSSTLAQRYAAYKQVRAAYLQVCEAGTSSYCAPSMFKLARLSQDFVGSLEDIEVQDTLAKEVVARFKNFKQSVFNDVTQSSQKADDAALASVAQGQTDPNWAQSVLWQNTSDWNLDRVTGETGNGYVQWTATEQ